MCWGASRLPSSSGPDLLIVAEPTATPPAIRGHGAMTGRFGVEGAKAGGEHAREITTAHVPSFGEAR